ncbi:Uncharacterised protein [uncultured Ruminococcus sp.]|jgi:hypothetical protein|nr:Uncharacterised protein [uncultured Ruminococcus sp.]
MKLNQEIRSNFQMIGNYVKKVSVSNDFLELPPMEQLNYNFEAEYDNVKIDDEESGGFLGSIDLCIKVIAKEKKSKAKMSFSIVLNGGFVDNLVDNKDEFEKFLTVNGSASLYGIARGIIISLSSLSMNGGQIILPMVNFFKMREKKTEVE